MPWPNVATPARRYWLTLAFLSALPVVLFYYWRERSMYFFAQQEPYADLFFFHDGAFIWIPLATLALATGLAFYPRRLWPAAETWLGQRPGTVAAAFAILAALLAVPVHQNVPFTMDEYAAVFQANVFAAGKWAAELPVALTDRIVLARFQNYFLTTDGAGHVIETYLPGYALLLTPFVKFGVGGWLNVLLGAALLYTLARIANEWLGQTEITGWLILLVLASPVFWMNSLSFYSLNARLLFNLLFAWALSGFTPRRAFLAGLAGGMAIFLHNPFAHAVFALPWLLYVGTKREYRRLLPRLLLGYLPFLLLAAGWLYLVWRFQTGNPQSASQGHFTHAWDVKDALTPPPMHGVTYAYWSILFCKLILWTAPGLWLFLGMKRLPLSLPLRLSLGSFALTFVAYSLAGNRVSQGFGWGHRYTYAALGAAFLLAAVAIVVEGQRSPRLRNAALVLVLVGIGVVVPLRLVQSGRFIRTQLTKLPCLDAQVPQVCLVSLRDTYYVADRIQNDPFLRTPRIVLESRGREIDRPFMAKHFPDYELHRWNGKSGVWLPRPPGPHRIRLNE